MKKWILACACCVVGLSGYGQDNFEIQVYESETTEKNATMLELHSNFTLHGNRSASDGVLASNHQLHESAEITHGFTQYFETGFYLFTSMAADGHYYFAGSHIRPRFAVPESWHWPFGAGLSTEIGYLTDKFTTENWSWEIRPIIDKKWRKWYAGINPAIEKALSGPGSNETFTFSPAARCTYKIMPKVVLGLEYYGSVGPVNNWVAQNEQQHNLFIASDLDLFPNWEINAGYGIGLNRATDNGIFKVILGYRFSKQEHKETALLPIHRPGISFR
jgi:hypothetical protein